MDIHYFAVLLLIINHCNGSNYRIQRQIYQRPYSGPDYPDVNDNYDLSSNYRQQRGSDRNVQRYNKNVGDQNRVIHEPASASHEDQGIGSGVVNNSSIETYQLNNHSQGQRRTETQRHDPYDIQQGGHERERDISNQNVRNQGQISSELQSRSNSSNERVWDHQPPSDHDDFHQTSQGQNPIQTQQNTTVTIAVLGRSGSGVSSTIRELIGPKSNCTKPDGQETLQNLLEYTITNIPSKENGQFYTLRLIDVPGFVDGRSIEDEAKILASLKLYSLTKGYPDFYLALSRFDDNRIDGVHSLFVQFLKRVELFHNIFLNNTANASNVNGSNIVFLLTRLMSETKTNQRRPQTKIGEFRRIIDTFTNLPTPHTIVVGDNSAVSEHEVEVVDGYYKLPNKQHYPKNIWQALINSTGEPAAANLLTSIMNNRETEMTCEGKFISTEWEYYDDDVQAFSYLLPLTNTTVEENEINTKIQDVFERNLDQYSLNIVQKTALQLRLQNDNLTTPKDLPTTLAERASFFQRNKQVSAFIPAQLLYEAFKLKMPEYIPRLTVGHGYVVMSDEISPKSPFIQDIYEPSSVGYQFPNFMKCRKLFSPETQYFKSYSTTMSNYITERLKYLDFEGKDNITEKIFKGKVKEGFNLKPEEGENVASLTAINEQRILTCNLVTDHSQWVLNPEFIEEVESLEAFNPHDRESLNEWNSWFEKWGSHIVTQGYGGGSIHGSIVGASVKKVLKNRSKIDETLNAIVKYIPLPFNDLGTPAYRIYGGESDSSSENLYSLDDEQRNSKIKNWESTLGSNFKMLTHEFRLKPISMIVKATLGQEKGDLIENAIGLLLNGNLKYSRKRKSKLNGGNGGNGGTENQGKRVKNNYREVDKTSAENNPKIGPDTINPIITNSSQPNSGGFLTYPTSAEEFEGHAVLQSQLNNTNLLIERFGSDLQRQKERDERKHREDSAKLQRDREEQRRRAQERSEEMRRAQAQAKRNRLFSYQTQWNFERDSQKEEEKSFHDMMNEMKRKELEREIAHKRLLEEMKNKNKEAEKKPKCTGWDKILCWVG